MPQFRRFTTPEVIAYLKGYNFTRVIDQWHIHHTWSPSYAQFTGSNYDAIQQGMKDFHIKNKGWSDIGQHFSLFPDGTWVLGRSLNATPASILGWNTGAIATEMIGNFDVGGDIMTDKQKQAIYEVTEFAIEQMKLVPHFHRDSPTAYKTCPGSGINREKFFDEVSKFTENRILKERAEQAAKEAKLAEQEKQRIEAERQAALEAARKKTEELIRLMAEVKTVFTDMITSAGKEHWANKYVMTLYDKKIVSGVPNGDGTLKFGPDKPITRAEAATLIAKTYESLEEKLKAITDLLAKAGIK